MIMLLVSICSYIGLVCAYKMHNLWVTVVVPYHNWKGYLPVGGRTPPSKFSSRHICFVLGSWYYILGWSPLVGYQLESWCNRIDSIVFPSRHFNVKVHAPYPWHLNVTVDDDIGRGYVFRRCADISCVKNKIYSHCKVCYTCIIFLWPIIHYDAAVRHIIDLILMDLVFWYA